MSWPAAQQMITGGKGITSNWWRRKQRIAPSEVEAVLTPANLDRHLHDYAAFGDNSPFISLAAGSVERDMSNQRNWTYSATDMALAFATRNMTRPGALFFCWVPVALKAAVEISAVAEEVRELNTYRRWSPYQLEGEITAKIHIPANQIKRVEWWDPPTKRYDPIAALDNTGFIGPDPLTNIRDYF